MANYYTYKPGLGAVGEYQSSGKPFASGSIIVPGSGSAPIKIEFPTVSSWFSICNRGNHHVRLGFSANGIKDSNYYCIHEDNHPTDNHFDLKVTEIYLISDNSMSQEVDVIAGLTNIETDSILNNWSGSAGVG